MKCYSIFCFMCMALFAANYDSINFEVPRFTNVVLCGTVVTECLTRGFSFYRDGFDSGIQLS
jgi:hypothetical protein